MTGFSGEQGSSTPRTEKALSQTQAVLSRKREMCLTTLAPEGGIDSEMKEFYFT